MTVTTQKSDQLALGDLTPDEKINASEFTGKARIAYVSFTQVGVGDVGSTIDLCKLPAGRVRVLGSASFLSTSAQSTARTLSVGNAAYTGIDGVAVAASVNSVKAAYSTASAALTRLDPAAGADPSVLFISKDGVTLQGVVAGDTIPDGATVKGWIAYVTD